MPWRQCVLMVVLFGAALGRPSMAQERTTAEDARSPAVAEVLALQDRMNDAALRGDGAAFDEFLSKNFVASDPSNTIRHRDDMIALFSSGQVAYSSVKTAIDYADQLAEDIVVVMGTEITEQSAVPSDTRLESVAVGKTLNRRFTNVYRKEDGAWRLLVKQSTITPAK